LINVTYTDNDELVAYKITNSQRASQTSQLPIFSVPLSSSQTLGLPPIQLQSDAMADAQLWGGQKYLPRFLGKGRVDDDDNVRSMIEQDGTLFLGSQGSLDNDASNKVPLWVDSQLILVSEQYFAFYWLAMKEQVFFGRPSAELILKLMRMQSQTDPVREHLDRCWLETEHMEDDLEVEGYRLLDVGVSGNGKSQDDDDYFGKQGYFE
jgi:hypothetical protein